MANDLPAGVERRQNHGLRDLFETAYQLVEPFFDPEAGWAGRSLEHLAFRVLRDNFPELSGEEVHAIVVSAQRIYIQRYPGKNVHLRHPGE